MGRQSRGPTSGKVRAVQRADTTFVPTPELALVFRGHQKSVSPSKEGIRLGCG
jgi:hypothetical protein